MNILSNDEMKEIEKELLNSYQSTQHKLKFNILQSFQQGGNTKQMVFERADSSTKKLIVKMVPLTKNLKTISLTEQQNGLFKVISYAFLLIIYKKQNKINQYLKDQIKSSLYSQDVNLLDVRNHSFNKKMKNQTIKVLIAQFFKEFQYMLESSYFKNKKLPIDQVIEMALHKNDLVFQGFHLFFRTILWKLQVQNAQNCIQQVSVQQAISNLVEYFDVNCRIFNNLYLFNDDGVFISQLSDGSLVFGDYFQNQTQFQDTQRAINIQKDINFQIKNTNLNLGKIISKQNEIEGQDIKIFNFMMDTDRNSESQIEQTIFVQKHSQSQTPYFVSGEQFAFGRKSDRPKQDSNHSHVKPPSNRFYNQQINQNQSQQQGFNVDQSNQTPTPFLGFDNTKFMFKQEKKSFQKPQINLVPQQKKLSEQKTFNFYIQNNQYFQQNDDSPTPVWGGNSDTFFKFPRKQSNDQKDRISQIENRGSSKHALQGTVHYAQTQNQKQSQNSKKNDRRHSVQYNKVDNNKTQMKTSKNQIKVIDQTASRTILLEDKNQQSQDFQQRTPQNRRVLTQNYFGFHRQNKGIGAYDNFSIPSSCTCCQQKKHKMKMQSNLFQIQICPRHNLNQKKANNNQSESQKRSNLKAHHDGKKQQILKNDLKNLGLKKLNQSVQNIQTNKRCTLDSGNSKGFKKISIQQNLFKPITSKVGTPQQNSKKSQEFIQFLKKDKKHLIKKIIQKRQNKPVQVYQPKPFQFKNNQTKISDKRIIKQSMFVEPNYLAHNNPQSRSKMQSFQNRLNNKSVTPTKKVQHSKSPIARIVKKQIKTQVQANSPGYNNNSKIQLDPQSKFGIGINANSNSGSFVKPSKLGIRLQSQPTQQYKNHREQKQSNNISITSSNKFQTIGDQFVNLGNNRIISGPNDGIKNTGIYSNSNKINGPFSSQFSAYVPKQLAQNGLKFKNQYNINSGYNKVNTSYSSNPTNFSNPVKSSNQNGIKIQYEKRPPIINTFNVMQNQMVYKNSNGRN